MGGNYVDMTTKEPCTSKEVAEKWPEIHQRACYNYGHGGYSGTFAEKPEIEVLDQTFESAKEAYDFVVDHNDKWGPATAVRLKDGRWYIGGWCSS